MVMSSLDGTIVATALPTITKDIGGFSRVTWVATAYLLAQVVSMPLYGKLGDQLGRKRVLLSAVVLFIIGSMACGLAQTMNELLAARFVQGIGGGGLGAVAMAVTADIIPAKQLGRWMGYQGVAFAVASVLGPVLGGAVRPAPELAVGVLHQPAGRGARDHPDHDPAARPLPPPAARARRVGRDPDHADARRVHRARQHRRHRLRLDLGGGTRVRGRHRGVGGRVRLPRAPGAGAGPAAAPVRRPGHPRKRRRQPHQRAAAVLRDLLRPAVHAGGPRPLARRRPGWCSSR